MSINEAKNIFIIVVGKKTQFIKEVHMKTSARNYELPTFDAKIVRPVLSGTRFVLAAPQKRSNCILITILLALTTYIFTIFYFAFPIQNWHGLEQRDKDVRVLYNLVNIQNQTINTLLNKVKEIPYFSKLYGQNEGDIPVSSASLSASSTQRKTLIEQECEARYGHQLVSEWQSTEEEWCAPSKANLREKQSSLRCYPFQQKHRFEQGKGKDTFCVAENFVIDFSAIFGNVVDENVKLYNELAYLEILTIDTLQANCKRTPAFNLDLLHSHNSKYFRSFKDNVDQPSSQEYEDVTTYFLPRDEDSENTFHSTADFLNMFLVKEILSYDVNEQQVLIMDKMPNTAYHELLTKAFAPRHGVHRHMKYAGKRVMFRKLIFHLESPASLIFPESSTNGPQRCRYSSLLDSYRRHVLQSFDLLDVQPPPVPTATLILRHRTLYKNVGRVLDNEDAVINALRNEGNMMRTNILDLATMSFGDQLKAIRSSNILVGVHGAGLTSIMFAADEAVLVEIHPSYREDRHFRHIARMTDKDYLPMRSLRRESCMLTSDNVFVPIPEFLATMDGAVRLARNYDSGVSECGLKCSPLILGMDKRLEPFYDDPTIVNYDKTEKSVSLDKSFPCPAM